MKRLWLLAALWGAWTGAPSAAETPVQGPPRAARALVTKLAAFGRAEVPFVRRFRDPFHDEWTEVHGSLVLEPPDHARLAFEETGEKVTLRGDGGEWLQPKLEQMLRFPPERAWAALRWWRLFAADSAGEFHERVVDGGEVLVRLGSGTAADSAWVHLGGDGLPDRIRVLELGDAPVTYELGRWRFVKARGRSDFVLAAPRGFEVFDLP